ncbi:hypothetical protein [Bradyrhizobium sp. Tv2a-2]|uniref:hypothetical protein n=1 Tax=Bradyrhizobium sp. Tv2a-2 TaxID=113395 RepID=UPI00041ECE47|nr:hypothetical protein [Bradyrhizobium sp. Tv2a-2]
MSRPSVKHLLITTVAAFALLEGAAAGAAELPAFEVSSFPATPVQVSVLGSAGVREQAATPTLTRDDMPASPHQLAVLTPRHGTVRASNETTIGAAHK